jgi:hypothetical protein
MNSGYRAFGVVNDGETEFDTSAVRSLRLAEIVTHGAKISDRTPF